MGDDPIPGSKGNDAGSPFAARTVFVDDLMEDLEGDPSAKIVHDLLSGSARLRLDILYALLGSPLRFSQLKPLVKGMAENNLTVALRRLQEDSLIDRHTDISSKPAIHFYGLTQLGIGVILEIQKHSAKRHSNLESVAPADPDISQEIERLRPDLEARQVRLFALLATNPGLTARAVQRHLEFDSGWNNLAEKLFWDADIERVPSTIGIRFFLSSHFWLHDFPSSDVDLAKRVLGFVISQGSVSLDEIENHVQFHAGSERQELRRTVEGLSERRLLLSTGTQDRARFNVSWTVLDSLSSSLYVETVREGWRKGSGILPSETIHGKIRRLPAPEHHGPGSGVGYRSPSKKRKKKG